MNHTTIEICRCRPCRVGKAKITTIGVCRTLTRWSLWGLVVLFIPQWLLYLTAEGSYAALLVNSIFIGLTVTLLGSLVVGYLTRKAL